ncbi:MAG TPA: alpha/beta fold hydrolase [Candidatus Angelobacter sp.]|nr:alpha/beta fold hydrolase [Candidatus Angelobacter sp.]
MKRNFSSSVFFPGFLFPGIVARFCQHALTLFALLFLTVMAALPSAARDENGSKFEAKGATIYYEVLGSGSGTPLMVANGGPGFDHTYLHVSTAWESLAKNRKVVLYDQRGTGRSISSRKDQTYTLADQIDDLDALRAHLGFDRIDLLGHSWGGFLAMAYAARHSDRISHLILVDSAAPQFKDTIFLFSNVFPEGVERQAALTFNEEMGDNKARDADLREYLSMLFYSPEKRDAFLANVDTNVYQRDVNEAVNHDISRFDLNPEIRKFRFPVLVVTGRYDMNVAPLVAYKIHQSISGSRFAVFERSGHLPFYEEPEQFIRITEEFLAAR